MHPLQLGVRPSPRRQNSQHTSNLVMAGPAASRCVGRQYRSPARSFPSTMAVGRVQSTSRTSTASARRCVTTTCPAARGPSVMQYPQQPVWQPPQGGPARDSLPPAQPDGADARTCMAPMPPGQRPAACGQCRPTDGPVLTIVARHAARHLGQRRGNRACLVARGLGRTQAVPSGRPHADVQPLFGAAALPRRLLVLGPAARQYSAPVTLGGLLSPALVVCDCHCINAILSHARATEAGQQRLGMRCGMRCGLTQS